VAAFALLGALGRRIDEARQRLRAQSGTLSALLVPAFGFYQLILLRGSLLAATAPLALLVCIPLLISTRRRAPAVPLARSAPPVLPPTVSAAPGRTLP
jgi:hypothetical protein